MVRGKLKWRTHEGESTDEGHRDGLSSSSDEVLVMRMEEGDGPARKKSKPTSHLGGASLSLCRLGAVRPQEDGWQEPDESRALRPVL
jgi:hypothetical protein